MSDVGREPNAQAALLKRAAALSAELTAVLNELAGYGVDISTPAGFDDTDADLTPENLVETHVAAERFNRPRDTITYLCRVEGCGIKKGGRWLASLPRIKRYLGRGE